jgi:Tfp pilus assembly protein PilN
MTGFNYLGPSRRPSFPIRLTVVAIDNRIRGPLATLLATIVLTTTLSAVQLARLHAAQLAYVHASERLRAGEGAVRDIESRQARLRRLRELGDYVAGVQRASLARTNELAWIGNRLPAQTWLRTLRVERGVYSLEGTCDRVAAVGAVMIALRDEAHPAIPQLVSLHDDRTSADRVRFTLRLQTQ